MLMLPMDESRSNVISCGVIQMGFKSSTRQKVLFNVVWWILHGQQQLIFDRLNCSFNDTFVSTKKGKRLSDG